MNELPNNIKRVALIAVWGFLLMALVFGYWQMVRAPGLRAHPYNPHAQQRAKSIKPGLIYTCDSEQGLDVVLTIDSEAQRRATELMEGKLADLVGGDAETELVEAGLGQGATLVTPVAMARLAATIATGGQVIQPYLVDRIGRQEGETVANYRGRRSGAAISEETARQVAGIMQLSVEEGTASSVALSGYRVAAGPIARQILEVLLNSQ